MEHIAKPKTILILIAMLTVSCEQEALQSCEDDRVKQIETFHDEEFANIPCSLQSINNNDKVVNLVIKTQADYEKYFICGVPLPEVDFEKYFILAGRYRHNQCAVFDSQQVLLCNNKIIYRVKMLEQVCQAFTNVFYVTVVENKFETFKVEFDVKFSN